MCSLMRALARLLPFYLSHALQSPVFLICGFLAFAIAGLELKLYSDAGWVSTGEFGRHLYGLTTLLGPLIGSAMIWRLASLDRAMEEAVHIRSDQEAAPLAASGLAGALAALLALVAGVLASGLIHVAGQAFTWAGWLYALSYLIRSFTAILIWTGMATIGVTAVSNPWGAFPIPIGIWVVALQTQGLPEVVTDGARALVMTDAGVVSPMTPWGVGPSSVVAWMGAFLLLFAGCIGVGAVLKRLHRRTFRTSTAIAALLLWGLLFLYIIQVDPVRMERAIEGQMESSYLVTAAGASDPRTDKPGLERVSLGPVVLYRPAGQPVPDELLPAYRAVWSWIKSAPWETGVDRLWVVPDYAVLPAALEGLHEPTLLGTTLLIPESLLRRFRTSDQVTVALRLTDSLAINRPARFYLTLWLISGGGERAVDPILAFLERYAALEPTGEGADGEVALDWRLPDLEIQRLAGRTLPQPELPKMNLPPEALPTTAPAPPGGLTLLPGRRLSGEELRQRDVMFSLMHRWSPFFHRPYEFSALEAHLVLRHWAGGEGQGHLPYIEQQIKDLSRQEAAR